MPNPRLAFTPVEEGGVLDLFLAPRYPAASKRLIYALTYVIAGAALEKAVKIIDKITL